LLPIVRPPVESPEVAALEEILQSRDLAIAIQGPAGAGKTTFAAEAVRAIEALSGKDVMVLAPSSSAVNELRSRVTPKAETIQQFMINPELQDAARGGVLRIDEASFLSARAGRWLLEFARDSGTRLVVPGDVRQHHSVERGDWLRVMEQTGAICYAAITKIFRQQIAPLRDAVRDLSQGKIEEGLDKLEKFGAICQVEDKTERLAKIAELHLAALKERKSSLIVAPTHGECRTICGAVREAMKGEGMLSRPEQTVPRLNRLNLTEAQRGDAVSYEPGYVVEFHRIVKGAAVDGRKEKRFRSGEQWTVVRRDPGGSVLVEREGVQKFLPLEHSGKFDLYRPEQIALAAGDTVRITKNFCVAGTRFRNNEFHRVAAVDAQTITFDGGSRIEAGSRFLHIDQGVAVTSYASQSRTIDQVIASAPVESFSQVNRAQFYVTMSRARQAMHLFTDSKAALREAACRPSERLSSSENEIDDLLTRLQRSARAGRR
jgi:ATP-dependent exoDNAse (exonuclease V) alpha subunit